MSNLALFASGSGSNAERIVRYFESDPDVHISMILSNKPDAYVLERARNLGVPSRVFNRPEFYGSDLVLNTLLDLKTDLIVLAGFLWLVPDNILKHYPSRILNIHPALLPDFGGKGMYGHHVHEAVIQSGKPVSGITIHLVDENYDRGRILFQAECPVLQGDTPDSLAERIHLLEHRHYPEEIKKYLESL
jgi:phosphoribosylglycinamide formyltransferase-1